MQGLWYGDRRDRVKWGALTYLAQRFGTATILQVAYFRDGEAATLRTDEGDRQLLPAVWQHFADLRRVEQVRLSLGVDIRVFDTSFDPSRREAYIESALCFAATLARPRLVFLDPDTGIEPGTLAPEHASAQDIRAVWSALDTGEVLAVYQHGYRDREWVSQSVQRLSELCGAATRFVLGNTAADVAMLWSRKGDAV